MPVSDDADPFLADGLPGSPGSPGSLVGDMPPDAARAAKDPTKLFRWACPPLRYRQRLALAFAPGYRRPPASARGSRTLQIGDCKAMHSSSWASQLKHDITSQKGSSHI